MMSRIRLAGLCALCLTAVACATAPDHATERSEPTAVEALYATADRSAASGRPLDPIALDVWRSAEFQRRFTQSYLAQTEQEPSVTEDEREELQEIFDAIAADDIDGAMAQLGRSLGPAKSAVFDFTLAGLCFQREELERASPLYRAAVSKHPDFRRAWRNLGLVEFRRGEFGEAAAALTRVLELGGADAITYGLLGFAYGNLGDHVAAESAYRMATLLNPATKDWKMGLARSFFEQQRFADAVALCDALLLKEPERVDLWLLQANAHIGLGRPLDALANYEVVERLGGATGDTLLMQGDIYVNEELFGPAVNAYVRALERESSGGVDRVLRAAKVLTARGELEPTAALLAGIERLRGDVLAEEERKDVLRLRARLAVAAGAGDEEARLLEEIVALDPLDGEALILLGKHAARAGDAELAVFYYERAAALEKHEADAKVQHAQLLVGNGDYAAALPLLRRAQTLTPRDHVQTYLDQVERLARGR